jgi:signal transduction histidine kinase
MPNNEDILILAPTGQDAVLIASIITAEGARPQIVRNVQALCEKLHSDESAAIIIAEEALTDEGILLINKALEAQEPWSDIPIILMTNGGETTLAILRIKRAFSPSGNITLLERPFRRITLESVIQVALRARRKQHEVKALLLKHTEATRMRDEFISIASHELKTPLTSLKLQTQINQRLLMGGGEAAYKPERMNRLVETTARQVDRLSSLVEDMLDISRINMGKLLLKLSTFDLAELIVETIERFLPQLEAAHCELHLDVKDAIIGSWDPYRMEQVISNLITNAIRYSPGMPIHVSLRASASGTAILVVRDEGQGIALENQERIFKRFERAVTNNNISGLGIGLYICRKIVEAHHGKIRVESKLGGGSSFIVEVPVNANTKAADDLKVATL